MQVLLTLLKRLVVIIGEPLTSEEAKLTCQVALVDIKLLCRLLGGGHHHTALASAFVSCASLLKPCSVALPVVGNALLCMAELCVCLRAHAIIHLPLLIAPLMELLSDLDLLSNSSLLLNCILCTLLKMLATLANFLSPYMEQIVLAVSNVLLVVVSYYYRRHALFYFCTSSIKFTLCAFWHSLNC